ncbi:alpha/beta hydrolase [Spongiivirga sp. MCCC 1A20706]|uniref:alpha/beta fold hydrolase n=1 Tax=Spongiivirga sp. MCCC 1A20706 TaxID=3160963 RepID=UPI0039772CCA
MKNIKLTFIITLFVSFTYAQNSAIKTEVKGNGNPIVFLPGFTTPGSVWNETLDNISGNFEYHLISYAGFNGIEPIEMPWYNNVKDAIVTYIKENELSNITLIGHSMGGNLAIDIAVVFKEEIKGIILVDSLPCMREIMMPGVKADDLQYDSPYNNQMLAMNANQFKQTAGFMAQNMTNQKDKISTLTSWILKADRKTYTYGYTDLLKLDLRDDLKNINTRTLILGASFPNPEMTKATFEKQYVNLSNKTIEIADDSKHFIMFDQPEWFYEKVNSFLVNE